MLYLSHNPKRKKNKPIFMPANEEQWNANQLKVGASFLQTLQWAKFQQSLGNNYHLLEGPGWTCLLLEKTNPFGKYLFAPHGPTLNNPDELPDCIEALTAHAEKVGAGWLKIEPSVADNNLAGLAAKLVSVHAKRAVHDVEPRLTRFVDIARSEDEIMASISQSTRSVIRKNQRDGTISFSTSLDPTDMASFSTMLDSVSDRKSVGFFNNTYFTKQAEILMPANMMFLELAFHESKLMGGVVVHDFGGTSYYTYAASLPEARVYSVSALLLWQALVNAKARGSSQFDLFGVVADDAPASHPWYGFSTFKKKFGGEIIEKAGTWDIAINSKYNLYRAAQTLRHSTKRR